MDNELFELCKEVYDRKSWKGGRRSEMFVKWHSDSEWTLEGADKRNRTCFDWTPLYTSDYLLPKLLAVTTVRLYLNSELRYDLMYEPVKPDYNNYSSDLIVKTLLKLVIALDDAGVKL